MNFNNIYFVVLQLIWHQSIRENKDSSIEYITIPSKHFVGVYSLYELALNGCLKIDPDEDGWPPHVWIKEVNLDYNQFVNENINIHIDNDFYIVNTNEKCLFSTSEIIYGNMPKEDSEKYIKILNYKENYNNNLFEKIGIDRIYHDGFDKNYSNRLNNKSFVFGLSLEKINQIITELEKLKC